MNVKGYQYKDYDNDVKLVHPDSFAAGNGFRARLHALQSVGKNNNWVFDPEKLSMDKAREAMTDANPNLINVENKNKFIQLINSSFVNYLTIMSSGSLILISLVDTQNTSIRYIVKILLQKTDDAQDYSGVMPPVESVLGVFYDKIAEIKNKDDYKILFNLKQRAKDVGIQAGKFLVDYKEYKKESDIQSLIVERYMEAEGPAKNANAALRLHFPTQTIGAKKGAERFSPKMHSLHSAEGANTEILEALLKNITPEAKKKSDYFDASDVAKQKRKNRFLAEYITQLILVKPYLPLAFIVMESVPKYFKTITEWKDIFSEPEKTSRTNETEETEDETEETNETKKTEDETEEKTKETKKTEDETEETEYMITSVPDYTFIFNRKKNAYWVYIQFYRMARLGFKHCDTHGGNIFIANPIISVIFHPIYNKVATKSEMTLLEIFTSKIIHDRTKNSLGRKIGIKPEGKEMKEIQRVYNENGNKNENIPLIYLIDFGLSKPLDSTKNWEDNIKEVINCFDEPYFSLGIWDTTFIGIDIADEVTRKKVETDCKKLPNPEICERNITLPNTPRDEYYEAKWEEIGDKVDCFSCKTACKKRKKLMDERKEKAKQVLNKLSGAANIPEKNIVSNDNDSYLNFSSSENNNNSNDNDSSLNFSELANSTSTRNRGKIILERKERNEQLKKQEKGVQTISSLYGNEGGGNGNYGGARRKKRKKTRKKRRKRRTRKQKKRSKATKRKKVKKTKTRKLK